MDARRSTLNHVRKLTDLLERMKTAAAEISDEPNLNWGHEGQTQDALRWTVAAAFAMGVVDEDESRRLGFPC